MTAPASRTKEPSSKVTKFDEPPIFLVNTTLETASSAPPTTVKSASFDAETVNIEPALEEMVADLETMTELVNIAGGQSLKKTISAPLV